MAVLEFSVISVQYSHCSQCTNSFFVEIHKNLFKLSTLEK